MTEAQSQYSRAFHLAISAADHLVTLRRLDAAATILENYLNAHPPEPAVLRRLGSIRLKQGRPREAARLLEHALARRTALDPLADTAACAGAA